ncbi:hypothetical protein SLA2020_229840 [Shorea laevis]
MSGTVMSVKGKKKTGRVREAIADLGMNPENAKEPVDIWVRRQLVFEEQPYGDKTKCLSISLFAVEENRETEK